jgi:ferritin-like metal-binding protein YciE
MGKLWTLFTAYLKNFIQPTVFNIYINQKNNIMAKSKNEAGTPNGHLQELFVDELKDILGAEKQLLKGLKKLSGSATNPKLKMAFDEHYTQTEGQIERLKQVFQSLGLTARAKKCKAMEGLLAEADEITESFEEQIVLDAALISAAQKVEHYEIASYGCLVTYAKLMGYTEAEELLSATLTEEKETDTLLTDIALTEVNTTA